MSVKDITLPPRVQIRIEDNRTGSYPTIARIGDDRTGVFNVSFDDSNTIIFASGALISLPTGLPTGSKFIRNQQVSGSSFNSVLGTVRKGVGDEAVCFTPGQDLTPFEESRHIEQSREDPFFQSGSAVELVGQGFGSRLASKTKIVIDLEPVISNTFEYHYNGSGDGPLSTAGSYQQQYYNFETKTWQGIFQGESMRFGSGTEESNLTFQTMGFGSSVDYYSLLLSAGEQSFGVNAAHPTDTYGFPFDPRYHATSSQQFDMSQVIDKPFLVEKVFYEFSGTLQNAVITADVSRIPITTFFILNQRGGVLFNNRRVLEANNATFAVTSSIPQMLRLTTGSGAPETFVDTIRDLVTYMQVLSRNTDTPASVLPFAKREVTIENANNTSGEVTWEGQFAMSGAIKSAVTTKQRTNVYIGGTSGDDLVPGGWPSGRTGVEMRLTGRSFVNDATGNIPSGSATFLFPALGFDMPVTQTVDSPYLLLPTDKLVFGWEIPEGIFEPKAATGFRLTLHPGAGKLIFYGSQVRENVEFHDTLNQLLTSNAVHEAIHFDNPVVDQFDVEPKSNFSGSYISNHVTGAVLDTSISRTSLSTDHFSTRVVVAQAVSGSTVLGLGETSESRRKRIIPLVNATTPGFIRGVQQASEHERFFDTIMPNIGDIMVTDGAVIEAQTFSPSPWSAKVVLGPREDSSFGPLNDSLLANDRWFASFPFEPKYSGASREVDVNRFLRITHARQGATGTLIEIANPIDAPFTNIAYYNGALGGLIVSTNDTIGRFFRPGKRPTTTLWDDEALLMEFFSVGESQVGTGSAFHTPDDTAGSSAFITQRGFKYGVMSPRPMFPRVISRYSRYGQFRDMLEQRLDSRFFDVVGLADDGTPSKDRGLRTGVVQTVFTSSAGADPYSTDSSNMSPEATSSLPYFDGVVRNR